MLRTAARFEEVEAAAARAMQDFMQNLVVLLFPPYETTRRGWMHLCFLYPLQCIEAMLIRPISQLRRHMPLVGGVCVIGLTLWSLFMRSVWRHVHQMVSTLLSSHHARLNFDAFWSAVDAHYVFTDATTCNWSLVHSIFGDKIEPSTSQDDLWTAIHDSMALLGDSSVRLLHPTTAATIAPSAAALLETIPLVDGEALHPVANHIAWGHVTPSVGFLQLGAMAGFVDLTFPLDCFAPPSSQSPVPEMYDVETLRWALQALIQHSRAAVHAPGGGLILDLRSNGGGGSHLAALAAASCFLPPNQPVFSIEEAMKSWGHVRHRTFQVPASAAHRYDGPLVVLQGPHTSGTAELLLLALQSRRRTHFLGEPTAGKLSDVMQVQLPNGWIVEMPFQQCVGVDGQRYQGVGIPPQTLHDATATSSLLSAATQLLMDL
ncbi:Aste57867_22273 [Aphanomyces stellatus]|uniref:Aste57867_22273 protein n=1 Tax=Aphanomyces stellatus TaxID=120398 RepID=A0A485LJW5_9STRA|nr:hypothetical protein As57867_022203 [Aphanomyces stellatus]VFT98939.1 Aste57867_22273 [Aphanomyces stellatus]